MVPDSPFSTCPHIYLGLKTSYKSASDSNGLFNVHNQILERILDSCCFIIKK